MSKRPVNVVHLLALVAGLLCVAGIVCLTGGMYLQSESLARCGKVSGLIGICLGILPLAGSLIYLGIGRLRGKTRG